MGEYEGDDEGEGFFEWGDHWQVDIVEAVQPDHDAGFRITGYEWSWRCDNCGVVHTDVNCGEPVTNGSVLTCLRCGADHEVTVEVEEP